MLWIMLAFTWAFAGLIYYGARRIARHEPEPAVSESWLKEHVYRDGKTAWD
jgi:hypothetical protein